MSIEKIGSIAAGSKLGSGSTASVSFKAVMDQKRAQLDAAANPSEPKQLPESDGVKNATASNMVKTHEEAIKTVRTVMTRTDYSPERLLEVQYKTGVLFLREQMLVKTAELTANTVKNFTQTQV